MYGTDTLNGGFTPDPFVIAVVAGGYDDPAGVADGCNGYISGDQPDYRLNYQPSTYTLGIFVDSEVDTTLIVNAPDGSWHCNDDSSSLDSSNPGISFSDPLDGNYDIWVGTYSQDDNGSDAMLVVTELGESQWSSMDTSTETRPSTLNSQLAQLQTGFADLLADVGGETATHRGDLQDGDATLSGYGYADSYNFSGQSGQEAVIDLRSNDFDTYLLVRTPSGEELRNDDYESSTARSLVSFTLEESGTYEVTVSSFMSDETGDYDLAINVDGSNGADLTPASRVERGELAPSDTTMASGEYVDVYEVDGRPGQQLTLDLRSDDFDTFLILQSPSGERVENDDTDSISRSFIESSLSELGTYQVMVTSYGSGDGEYELTLEQSTDAAGAQTFERDVVALDIGNVSSGNLQDGDLLADSGSYEDNFSFQGNAGDTLRINLASDEFDTYLRLITPTGETIENDDFEGSTQQSVIELTLQETGRYRVLVTSYSAGSTGSYELSAAPVSSRVIVEDSTGGRIFGIFAGISDYPGTDADLSYTDQDATRARDALIAGSGMSPDNAITLLNEQATIGNLRSAIERMAASITPGDTFVLFYSGHGSRVERQGGPDSADPDGLDETIELYDGSVLDDELNQLLNTLNAGTTLLVLDSCFSGGFAKDIVSRPGRMGLFSSEEDVTSQVAAKFRAGGYLSVFFEEALEGYADFDENGELTALELSEYLHGRFRVDVKSVGADQYVLTGGPQAGYQHLVVDRGGIGPYSILFNHR